MEKDCRIVSPYIDFLMDAKYLYCCTIDVKKIPHVVPMVFIFDYVTCTIFCITGRNSMKVKNMKRNPYVTFTTDETHPKIPLLNTGIMVESTVELTTDDLQIGKVMTTLNRKYKVLFGGNLFHFIDTSADILIRAHPRKIIFWKGPFFERFHCKYHRTGKGSFWKKKGFE